MSTYLRPLLLRRRERSARLQNKKQRRVKLRTINKERVEQEKERKANRIKAASENQPPQGNKASGKFGVGRDFKGRKGPLAPCLPLSKKDIQME